MLKIKNVILGPGLTKNDRPSIKKYPGISSLADIYLLKDVPDYELLHRPTNWLVVFLHRIPQDKDTVFDILRHKATQAASNTSFHLASFDCRLFPFEIGVFTAMAGVKVESELYDPANYQIASVHKTVVLKGGHEATIVIRVIKHQIDQPVKLLFGLYSGKTWSYPENGSPLDGQLKYSGRVLDTSLNHLFLLEEFPAGPHQLEIKIENRGSYTVEFNL